LGGLGGACDHLGILVTRQNVPHRPVKKAPNRRASPEAVEKRRAARLFNKAVLGDQHGAPDGRTERRRRRLLEELASGTARGGKRELKPIDVLARAAELLSLGEPLASIRKACPRVRPVETTPEIVEGLRRIHQAYAFPAEVYALVGLDAEALRRAGIGGDPGEPAKPGLRSAVPRRRLTGAAARG
jgi:hypothetical protein